jgi:hypothetical protein
MGGNLNKVRFLLWCEVNFHALGIPEKRLGDAVCGR